MFCPAVERNSKCLSKSLMDQSFHQISLTEENPQLHSFRQAQDECEHL